LGGQQRKLLDLLEIITQGRIELGSHVTHNLWSAGRTAISLFPAQGLRGEPHLPEIVSTPISADFSTADYSISPRRRPAIIVRALPALPRLTQRRPSGGTRGRAKLRSARPEAKRSFGYPPAQNVAAGRE